MLYMYVSYIFIGDYAIKSNIKCHLNSIHTSKVDTYNNLQKNINLFGFQLFFHKKSIKQNKLQSSESFLFICGNSNIVILAFSCLKLFKYVFNFFFTLANRNLIQNHVSTGCRNRICTPLPNSKFGFLLSQFSAFD